jgi:hypothetical protein
MVLAFGMFTGIVQNAIKVLTNPSQEVPEGYHWYFIMIAVVLLGGAIYFLRFITGELRKGLRTMRNGGGGGRCCRRGTPASGVAGGAPAGTIADGGGEDEDEDEEEPPPVKWEETASFPSGLKVTSPLQ